MVRRALLGMIVLLVGSVAPVFGQDATLKFKFKEGEKFWVEDVVTSEQTISLLGQPIKSKQKTNTLTSYTVKTVTADKVELTMKIEDVAVQSEGGLGGQLDKVMEKTKGFTFDITLTPEGKVMKFGGLNAAAKQLAGGEDDAAKVIKELLNEDMFVKTIEQAFGFLPPKAVKKGDTWTREGKYPLGPLGAFKTTSTYTYNGRAGEGEDISVKQVMQYVVPQGGGLAGLFKVVKGDLKADKATGSYVFNAETGRLVSASETLRIGGTLTVEAGGQEVQLEMTTENTGTSRVFDKNPRK
jgi:hypothetical protein